MNTHTFDKLQYSKLKDMIKSHCVSGLGKNLLDKLEPVSSLKAVKNRLNETSEARAILNADGHVPFSGVTNIEGILQNAQKGMILNPGELVSLSDFLRGCRKLKRFMLEREFFAPVLASYAQSMSEYMDAEDEINTAIKDGIVDSSASRVLRRIRGQIEIKEEKIKALLTKFMNSSENKKYIQDFFITRKNDRFTIPIKASFKNQVSGSIVEASSTGSTVFMEPPGAGKLNGELEMLKAEESVEEYQILATLIGIISENLHGIHINMELISQYDMVFAKAKYSQHIQGIEPALNDTGHIRLVQCRHPLLTGKAVPLDFEIGNEYRSLVITGPNAGGKTIVLKTIGLLTLAVMSGFHIPADKGTEISVFNQIFADIGDNQSIENALSTFSSHMKNLSEIMSAATNHTLLLFDEIGSGTEPNEGAALAISILEEFYHMGCMTVATTHYGEIKRFSELHPDFMNAAMQFDQETLEPAYRLIIGKSGDSNALWISRKMNMRSAVLERAEAYMDNKAYRLERVDANKVRKPKADKVPPAQTADYQKGDKVTLLDYEDTAIVYKERDKFRNVTVFYKGEMLEINDKKLTPKLKAAELYPDGYDLEQLFTDYQTRKLRHDIERGSKKALRKIYKEIKKSD
ncbi:endonuclease MutS2 [Bacillus sp. FJAT-42376]|uniref:endonuclease MutS2 n=1 Tax=Bacillus sp. FJAT-42376 TaxID=2014076 RepID=UPI000F4DDECE|nr:endonuclease MutS2 [Bacillus sp. FJAT-42376]AZB41489.1 endonuclease MutS2 [Bacillus sp. FJAT-42376]